jgi:3-oxoacyl-[acyl-carrier-protein] synthase-3
MNYYSRIVATGSYLPERILSNQELESLVDTSDEWIISRTGINKRHIIGEAETCSDMGAKAALNAIESGKIDKNTIDMIIVATFTPDIVVPANACIIQQKLGLTNIPAFDLNAACSGFLYALTTADAYIKSGLAKTILVIGSDAISHYIDYTDRNTCVLFGDGAGAVILQQSDKPGILASEIHADGSGEQYLHARGQLKNGKIVGHPFIFMDGRSVFKMAVTQLASVANNILDKAGYHKEQIDWLIPHQANIRIIEATAKHLGLSMDKVIVTVDNHGNTSAASIPLALDVAYKTNKIKPGELILLEGFGAGYTWGGCLIKL